MKKVQDNIKAYRCEFMNIEDILSKTDHTILSQTATISEIRKVCDEAQKYKTASVCIPPCYVKPARDYVETDLKICTVIGFPNGYSTTRSKVFEAEEAINNGADEIDMVINIGWVKDFFYDKVEKEIRAVKACCGKKILKVIIETCLLNDYEKIKLCQIVTETNADYIKTSTGFSKAGAMTEDIKLFLNHIGKNVKIKASGGISSLEDAQNFINLGVHRLGSSKIVKLVQENSSVD